jgi:hypothetical protein
VLNCKRLASALLVIGMASLAGSVLAASPHSDDGHGAGHKRLGSTKASGGPDDRCARG